MSEETEDDASEATTTRFPEPDTQPFWEATKRHELTYQTCDKCHAVVFYSRRHCTRAARAH